MYSIFYWRFDAGVFTLPTANRHKAVESELRELLIKSVPDGRTRLNLLLWDFDDNNRLLGIVADIDIEEFNARVTKCGFDFGDS